jgi:hypothetical protein
MNNMFVSLLTYLTLAFHQQPRRRLHIARTGALVIGIMLVCVGASSSGRVCAGGVLMYGLKQAL